MRQRTVSFCLVLLIFCCACKPQKEISTKQVPVQGPPGSTVLPAEFVASLREDAAYLAINEIKLGHEQAVDLADLPPAMLDKYQKILIKVHEFALQTPGIPPVRKIHQFPSPDLRQITVVLNPDCSFLENWKKGIRTTDNLYLNQLIQRYNLEVGNFSQMPIGPRFILSAQQYINTPELSKALAGLEGFRIVEAEAATGDGNRILLKGSESEREIIFSLGYGDCQSGCISRSFISFMIKNGKEVSYKGLSGDPLPEGWQ